MSLPSGSDCVGRRHARGGETANGEHTEKEILLELQSFATSKAGLSPPLQLRGGGVKKHLSPRRERGQREHRRDSVGIGRKVLGRRKGDSLGKEGKIFIILRSRTVG